MSAGNPGFESDLGNRNFSGAMNPDEVLLVRFYDEPFKNEFESIKQDRPIMEMRTMIEISIPGPVANVVVRPKYIYDEARFPRQWMHFKSGKEGGEGVTGTLLTEWPLLNPAQVAELKHFKLYTVEQVANASDQQISAVGMVVGMGPHIFREKAQRFLKLASDSSLVSQQDAELKAMREEMAKMRELIASKVEPAPAPKKAEKVSAL